MLMRLAATMIAMFLALPAWAQFTLGGGVDYMHWTEDTSPEVHETGLLAVLTAGWTMSRERGALFAWRGSIYGGDVDYDGATLFPPVRSIQGTTSYRGTTQEAQFRYRIPARGSAWVDVVVSGGIDLWERKLNSFQKENYLIGFARLGFELDRSERGIVAAAGLKQPFHTYEEAYLDGMNPNPIELKPGKKPSAYAMLGYRFDAHWKLMGVFDALSLGESPSTGAFVPGFGSGQFFQPASTLYRIGVRVEYTFR